LPEDETEVAQRQQETSHLPIAIMPITFENNFDADT